MNRRYILAPEAALDLVQIWRYIKNTVSIESADQVEAAISVSGTQRRWQSLAQGLRVLKRFRETPILDKRSPFRNHPVNC